MTEIVIVITLMFNGPPATTVTLMRSMEECERYADKWRRDFGKDVEVTCQVRQKAKAFASS